MAKDKKGAAQQPKKEVKTPKTPGKAPKVENPATEQVVESEAVSIPMISDPKKLVDRKHSGLSPDGQVRLLDLARRTFVEETDPDLQFPQAVRKSVNDIVAIGIMCTFADHAANGDNSFALVLQSQAYPTLTAAAKAIGIELPDIKALPAGKEEGTVMLPADKAKISKETKEQLKKEKEIREGEKPELDPEKITSEEDLKKALEYIFVSSNGKSLPKVLTTSIDFMKKFRLHEASLAENATEAKARFESYNSGDWLDDIFSYFRPPIFFNGIGRGMATVTEVEKSPVHAFIIFRDAIRDKETGEPVLEDQEIAYCVRCIVKWFCDTNINSNKKAIEELDKEKNKDVIVKCEEAIAKYNNILDYITNPSSAEADTLPDNIGAKFDAGGDQLTTECQAANSIFNKICKSYYGKQLSDADYKNLVTNVQQYCYHIINIFRAPGERIADCGIYNVTELEERTEEEKEALRKEAKKAWAERKSAEEKNG